MMFPAFWTKSGRPLVNHLWQSTVVVLVAWLLALALQEQSSPHALLGVDDRLGKISDSVLAR